MILYNIVLFPYAGGSSYSYMEYIHGLEKIGRVYLIDYAGHGKRFKEKPANTFIEVLDDVERQMEKLPKENLVLFGHSMGALIAAYTAMRMYMRHNVSILNLILSCCVSPDKIKQNMVKNTSKDELIHYLYNERNIPIETIMSKKFQKYFWPVIKNDFDIIREFEYIEMHLHNCSLYCIYADNDPIAKYEDVLNWKSYTNNSCSFIKVEGGHFFFEEKTNFLYNFLRDIIKEM